MIEKMRPLRDRVLVKRLELESKTPGGLYIPDAAKEKPQHGVVVSTGPGRLTNDGQRIPMSVKAGDTIFFGKYAGTEASAEYLIISEDEILGIVEDAAQ